MKFKRLPVRLAVLALFLPAAFVVSGQDLAVNTLPETLVTGSRIVGPRDAQPFGTSVITAGCSWPSRLLWGGRLCA
jgi:hypothetical protein